ncbi:MAG: peroxidase-related enzyme [Streptosporangiales bacterium]
MTDGTDAGGQRAPVSRFPVPELDDLPEDIAARIKQVEEKTGFVPNVFRALAHRPAEWRAFFDYHDALMDKETPALSKGDRELIVVATSAENDCLYCVVAHGAVARIRSHNPRIADQVATDWRKAELDDRQRAMLAFAVKLATRSAEVLPADLDALREHGFTEDDIWDIGAITGFFGLSNRLAHLAAIPPNDEFYLMGRIPRDEASQQNQP